MSEWTSPYNPFNSMKALTHATHFERIIDGKPLPPIVVNMDLTNRCNYNCRFCMFGGQRERADSSGAEFRKGNAKLQEGYALTLPELWSNWGVRAVCLAGGGEPSLHPDCFKFIDRCRIHGLDLGFVTNGFLLNSQERLETICESAKFTGISMDAGTPNDYSRTKGVPETSFWEVVSNIGNLAKVRDRLKSKLQIGYKFVLDEENYKSIYEAAKVASEIGVNHFQFRPAINPNYQFFKDKLPMIWEQIDRAQKEFERPDYHVFGVKHKFNTDLTKKHNFKVCRANMLTTTWAADGKVYMCTDSRGNPWSYLTDHYPNPQKVIEYWGGEDHKRKVRAIDFHKNCDRCTLAPYNEMFEQVFIDDGMDRWLI